MDYYRYTYGPWAGSMRADTTPLFFWVQFTLLSPLHRKDVTVGQCPGFDVRHFYRIVKTASPNNFFDVDWLQI